MQATPNLQDVIKRAQDAIKSGDLDYGERLMAQAQRIKAGQPAGVVPTPYEAAVLQNAAKGLQASAKNDRKIDKAMQTAIRQVAVDELDPAIEALADQLHGGDYGAAVYAKAAATKAFLSGREYDQEAARMVVLSPAQLRQALGMGLSAYQIKSTMIEAQDTLGGFLLAGTISEKVLARASSVAVVRSRATVDTTTDDHATFPLVVGNSDVYSSGLRGSWMSETASASAENVTFGAVKVPVNLWRLPLRLTRSLLEDAGPRITDLIIRLAGEAIGMAEDADFLTGPGATRPLGILATDGAGTLIASGVRVTNSGNPATITADSVINMIYSLPAQYRRTATACVACTSTTLKTIRTFKDGAGQPIFHESDGTLCGMPLAESESMPEIAANSYPLLAGDFVGYSIADRVALGVERFIDSSTADQDQVLLNFRRRLGGQPGEAYRFAALKVST